jgi:surface antigen
MVHGSDWFGGHGVDVISNGFARNECDKGLRVCTYQCVELVERFLQDEHFGPAIPGNANQLYANASSAAYDHHPNGSGYVPVPGDIIVLSGGPWGHVVIVDQVVGSSVYVVEQNASASGRNAISINGSTLGQEYGMSVIGVLHAKANTAGNPPSPSSPGFYSDHIVQWSGDTKSQKTAWLVGPDLHRRWIPDASTYNCLKSRGFLGPDVLRAGMLNQLPDLTGVWAVCDASRIGVNSMLQRGADARSPGGGYHLELQRSDGNLVLYNSAGHACWATNKPGADYLVLQADGNLVAYTAGGTAVWATNTVGSGATSFNVQSDGNLVLYSPSKAVWASNTVGCSSPTPVAHGTVEWTGGIGLNERSGPGPNYALEGNLPDGTVVNIVCQTAGPSETGHWGPDSLWDKLDNSFYVSDAWVYTGSNGQVAPTC